MPAAGFLPRACVSKARIRGMVRPNPYARGVGASARPWGASPPPWRDAWTPEATSSSHQLTGPTSQPVGTRTRSHWRFVSLRRGLMTRSTTNAQSARYSGNSRRSGSIRASGGRAIRDELPPLLTVRQLGATRALTIRAARRDCRHRAVGQRRRSRRAAGRRRWRPGRAFPAGSHTSPGPRSPSAGRGP